MKFNSLLLSVFFGALITIGCTSGPARLRQPSGTVEMVESTEGDTSTSVESYQLPITRNGKKVTRLAYNFWSGEWPMPVVDVNSEVKGTTRIQGYPNLRDPQNSEKTSCTIQNGLYHPWSKKDSSIETYYSIVARKEFKAVKKTSYEGAYDAKKKRAIKVRVPAGTIFKNVIYYGENFCGATQVNGKVARPMSVSCEFFDSKGLVQTKNDTKFEDEQWLYFACEEKDASGKIVKVFVQDKDLIKQDGISEGCPAEYGEVQGAKNCNQD